MIFPTYYLVILYTFHQILNFFLIFLILTFSFRRRFNLYHITQYFCFYFKKKSHCSQDGAQFVDRFFCYFFTIFVPFRCFVCDNVLSY